MGVVLAHESLKSAVSQESELIKWADFFLYVDTNLGKLMVI